MPGQPLLPTPPNDQRLRRPAFKNTKPTKNRKIIHIVNNYANTNQPRRPKMTTKATQTPKKGVRLTPRPKPEIFDAQTLDQKDQNLNFRLKSSLLNHSIKYIKKLLICDNDQIKKELKNRIKFGFDNPKGLDSKNDFYSA